MNKSNIKYQKLKACPPELKIASGERAKEEGKNEKETGL